MLQATSLRALHAELQTRALDPLLTVVGGVANADMTFLQTHFDYRWERPVSLTITIRLCQGPPQDQQEWIGLAA